MSSRAAASVPRAPAKQPSLSAPSSPPTLHHRQGGWSHHLWLTAFTSPIPAHLNAWRPLAASPGSWSMHGLPLKSPFQAPHNRYLIANRINCNCFFKAQSIWDNVQRHRGKEKAAAGCWRSRCVFIYWGNLITGVRTSTLAWLRGREKQCFTGGE